MGPDHVPLVRADQELLRSLPREHVEVVHPEVDHHLVELALGVGRPHHLGRLQLLQDLARPALHLLEAARVLPQELAARAGLVLFRGVLAHLRPLLLDLALDLARHLVPRDEVRHGEAHRAIPGQPGRERPVVDPLRMELELDPPLEPERADLLDVARPWTVAEPVQGMDDPRVLVGRRGARARRGDPRGEHEGEDQDDGSEPAEPPVHAAPPDHHWTGVRRRWLKAGGCRLAQGRDAP